MHGLTWRRSISFVCPLRLQSSSNTLTIVRRVLHRIVTIVPVNMKVNKFRASQTLVMRGMEPICQSYDKLYGNMIKCTLNAAKYQKVNSLMIDVEETTNHGRPGRERERRWWWRNVDYTLLRVWCLSVKVLAVTVNAIVSPSFAFIYLALLLLSLSLLCPRTSKFHSRPHRSIICLVILPGDGWFSKCTWIVLVWKEWQRTMQHWHSPPYTGNHLLSWARHETAIRPTHKEEKKTERETRCYFS